MKIRHAIFDMDGTLTDSNGVWERAVYNYIDNHCTYSRENIPEVFFSEIILGGTMEALRYLKSEMGDGNDIDDMLEIIMSKVEKLYCEPQMPKKGVLEFLEKLKKLGADVCVVSATPSNLVERALELSGILPYVDFIISGDERKTGKEKPYVFLEAAARMNCEPMECVLFEDALYSIKTGKSLGMTVVGVDDYYCRKNTREEIKKMCDVYIDDYSSITLD